MKKKGFTLVELIAAMALLMVVLSVVAGASSAAIKMNKQVEENSNTYNFNQYIIQTFKSGGKSYVNALSGGSGAYKGYFYFNNKSDIDGKLNIDSFLTDTGDIYAKMIAQGAASGKKYGACFEFSTSNMIGQTLDTNANITLNSKLNACRMYVRVVEIGKENDQNSSLVVYLGR